MTFLSRQIHEVSPRAQQPFLHVACGALPKELIESELFGHSKGAFTSAHADKEGKFIAAGAGTIRLEHLRYDPDRPDFLLDLAPTAAGTFESVLPHRCGADLYRATVTFADDGVRVRWDVKGPKKDMHTCCVYARNASFIVDE